MSASTATWPMADRGSWARLCRALRTRGSSISASASMPASKIRPGPGGSRSRLARLRRVRLRPFLPGADLLQRSRAVRRRAGQPWRPFDCCPPGGLSYVHEQCRAPAPAIDREATSRMVENSALPDDCTSFGFGLSVSRQRRSSPGNRTLSWRLDHRKHPGCAIGFSSPGSPFSGSSPSAPCKDHFHAKSYCRPQTVVVPARAIPSAGERARSVVPGQPRSPECASSIAWISRNHDRDARDWLRGRDRFPLS